MTSAAMAVAPHLALSAALSRRRLTQFALRERMVAYDATVRICTQQMLELHTHNNTNKRDAHARAFLQVRTIF